MSKNKLRLFKYIFTSLAYIGLFCPLTVVLIKNWNIYFTQNKSAFSVGMGGIMAILMGVLLLKVGFKKFHRVFWATALLISVYCLESIIKDSLVIIFAFWLGVLLFSIFEKPMDYFKHRLSNYLDEVDRTHAREATRRKIEENTGGRC